MSGSAPGSDAAAPPKPRLKINVSRSSSFVEAKAKTKKTSSSAAGTPTEGGGGGPRKVKLKIGKSQPTTPAEPPAPKTKAGRQTKPTQKLVESKKRAHDELDDDLPLAASSQQHLATKIKLKASKSGVTPTLVVKPKGRAPVHPPGDGYDSEASDREKDPSIEEQFILRMPPGDHCEYVRQCMENGKMGVPRGQGGADVQLKFFEEDTRRAVMTVKGQPFAAVMVDLPTITEAMKTWDRKSFLKSADICQMLLVFQKVSNEAEARQAPLPSMIDQHFRWPHGLTPPMHDCVNRRFAKTISRKEIEDKEAEVERLLAEDAKAGSTRWEWVDERQQEEDEYGAEEDAEGEMDDGMDYFQSQDVFGEDNDLEADLEAAFADDLFAETPATGMDAPTPLTTTQVNTPAAIQDSIEADESEEVSDDDDDDDDDEDLDDDARAQRDEEQGVKDIINDLKKQLANKQAELARTQNKILRTRIEQTIKQLKSEIELKNSSIGIETDD
ncbi:hypothetical protein CEP53_013450 [Fusarium sp. AF-6]|nr:hypothetical protein CEP53_013450 [Fusarium sp. AF-6]